MSYRSRRPALLALTSAFAIVLVACSAGASPSAQPSSPGDGGTPPPSSQPSDTPTSGAIDHETGATDVVLRLDEGGGFVMPAFLASQVPQFTLYGDGTVIFRNPMLEVPPAQGSVFTFNPMRTAKLSEEQIQELLLLALGEGGLAAARANYTNDMVADASTTVFTVEAGGVKKTVSIYALGMDTMNGADAPARAAFQKLAARLTDFDQGGAFPTAAYLPTAYRGVLFESPGVAVPDVRAWPWPDLKVEDFAPDADPNGLQFPHRTLTTDEVAALHVEGFQGGFQGLVLTGSDKKLYTLALRPLLPDDEG
ncbi:MAG: hypothetical protein ACXW4T_03155 [Candidatus Limnocylindrales bacterium]